jgi:hypothetical protein
MDRHVCKCVLALKVIILSRIFINFLNVLPFNKKGDVVLRNLQLKKEALDKFNLPIDVLEGVIF